MLPSLVKKSIPTVLTATKEDVAFQHLLTNTDPSIQAHSHPGHTLAAERSLRVDAVAVHTHAWSLTLINVWRQRVTSFLNNTSLHQMNGERIEPVQINRFPIEAMLIKVLKCLIH